MLPAVAFVAFPLSFAAGLLLLVCSVQLRQALPGAEAVPASRELLLRACTAVVVGIGLFSAAANYATVEGTRLADGLADSVTDLPGVVIYSSQRLRIDTPGSSEERLEPAGSAYRFRYLGFRLLEHTGGHYFLVTDEWNPDTGRVVMLADDAPLRLEFVIRHGSGP